MRGRTLAIAFLHVELCHPRCLKGRKESLLPCCLAASQKSRASWRILGGGSSNGDRRDGLDEEGSSFPTVCIICSTVRTCLMSPLLLTKLSHLCGVDLADVFSLCPPHPARSAFHTPTYLAFLAPLQGGRVDTHTTQPDNPLNVIALQSSVIAPPSTIAPSLSHVGRPAYCCYAAPVR